MTEDMETLEYPDWYDIDTGSVKTKYPEWSLSKNTPLADGWWTNIGKWAVLIRVYEFPDPTTVFEYRLNNYVRIEENIRDIWHCVLIGYSVTYIKNNLENVLMESIL